MFNRLKTGLALSLLACMVLHPLAVSAAEDDKPVLFAGKTPDEVYRQVLQAKWRFDLDTVLACLSKRRTISREDLYDQILMGRKRLPQELHLLSAKPNERVTTLDYMGIRLDEHDTGKTFYWRGTVTCVKEDGTWRIRHETWKEIPAPQAFERDAGNRSKKQKKDRKEQ